MSAQVTIDFSWVQYGAGVWNLHHLVMTDSPYLFDQEDVLSIESAPFRVTLSCESAARDYISAILMFTEDFNHTDPTFTERTNQILKNNRV